MIPDWAWTWFMAILMICFTVGAGTFMVYVINAVSQRIDFLGPKRDDAERRLADRREHDKKLMELKYEQAKYIASLNIPEDDDPSNAIAG